MRQYWTWLEDGRCRKSRKVRNVRMLIRQIIGSCRKTWSIRRFTKAIRRLTKANKLNLIQLHRARGSLKSQISLKNSVGSCAPPMNNEKQVRANLLNVTHRWIFWDHLKTPTFRLLKILQSLSDQTDKQILPVKQFGCEKLIITFLSSVLF